MTDNPRAVIGGNLPPSPIDQINAAHDAVITEAALWLDGSHVQTEAQMNAVDALRRAARDWRLDLERGLQDSLAPILAAEKAGRASWAPSIKEAKRYEAGLVAVVAAFKTRLAAEKAERERAARAAADEALRVAQEARRQADAMDLDAQRESDRLMAEAEAAKKAAAVAAKDGVKGMRLVTHYYVIDPVALARHLWAIDKEAQMQFQADRARLLNLHLPGVFEQRKERVAV
jgi:hypothetical protein